MDSERSNAPGDRQAPEALGHSVGWCDPRLCQPDATGAPGRWHYAIGDAISPHASGRGRPCGQVSAACTARGRRPAR